MKFASEEDFRQWIISQTIPLLGISWRVLSSKNVSDIIITNTSLSHPVALFLEVKYHKINHARIGIGDAYGNGFQPEILMKSPPSFEHHMRWIIGDELTEKCLFFTNKDVRDNAAAKSIKTGKQNNFVNDLFNKCSQQAFDISIAPIMVLQWSKNYQAL